MESNKNKAGLVEQQSQRTLLLQKIKDLLASADPDTWRKGGDEFVSGRVQDKPRQTWEEIYSLEISKGTLVFRRSTPLKSEFLGRGFVLTRAGNPEYFVELRAKGWHHSELTDPYKRSRNTDNAFTLLAETNIAEELYAYVTDSYNSYHNQKQAEFDREVYTILKLLPEKLQNDASHSWEQVQVDDMEVKFVGKSNEIQIEVSRKKENGRFFYSLVGKRLRELSKVRDEALAKEIFEAVEELGQTSRLLTLSKALENL
jgi:hypothetical protein